MFAMGAFTGTDWRAGKRRHDVAPLLVAEWRLASTPKDLLRLRDPEAWVVFPTISACYAVLRGALAGFRHRPFPGAARLGPLMVALSIAQIMLAFLLPGGLARISR